MSRKVISFNITDSDEFNQKVQQFLDSIDGCPIIKVYSTQYYDAQFAVRPNYFFCIYDDSNSKSYPQRYEDIEKKES